MQNHYYNPEISVLLCRCRMVSVLHDWKKSNSLLSNFWRLYYHPKENVKILYDSKSMVIPPRKIVLIPPNTELSHMMNKDFKQFYIHFLASAPYGRCRPGVYLIETNHTVNTLLQELLLETEKNEALRPSLSFSIRLEALCGLAISYILGENLEQFRHTQAIETAVNYIDKHFQNKLSNDELAKASGMATNSFIRLFHRQTDRTPQQYLRERRIRWASVLLRYSGKSIGEIADECGFATRYHFSRIFKEVTGYAPAEFRNMNFEL